MKILGYYGEHDSNASIFSEYERGACVASERITRVKNDGREYPLLAINECLRQSGISINEIEALCLPRLGWKPSQLLFSQKIRTYARGAEQYKCDIINAADPSNIINVKKFLSVNNLHSIKNIHFYKHHKAHSLCALSCVTWQDGIVYTADGGGDAEYYNAFLLRGGELKSLLPHKTATLRSEAKDSIGLLYAMVTEGLGFKSLRHEGKVLGLAAFGSPVFAKELLANYFVENDGSIKGRLHYDDAYRRLIQDYILKYPREDVAASLQFTLESLIISSLEKLIIPNKVKNLCLSGGVFANVKLNQRIQERFQLDQLFIYPAMSDAGLSAGGCLDYLFQRDGVDKWLSKRAALKDVYLGYDYTNDTKSFLEKNGCTLFEDKFIEKAAALLQKGKIIGLYLGRMEYGPRALGNRTILAQATDRHINQWLNQRLDRTDFMPFAPVVKKERAQEIFDIPEALLYPCEFMTVTVNVKKEWLSKIPAVVHVDGTARPQVIRREKNQIYYDIITEYEKSTGIPVLINTSFNVHEEPIINTPNEAFRALADKRIDYLITKDGLWSLDLELSCSGM